MSDDKLLGLFASGATLVLQGLHRTWGPLIDFTSSSRRNWAIPSRPTPTSRRVRARASATTTTSMTSSCSRYPVRSAGRCAPRCTTHPCATSRGPTTVPRSWRPRVACPTTSSRCTPVTCSTSSRVDPLGDRPRRCQHAPDLGVHVWTRRHVADELVSIALAEVARDERVRASLDVSPTGFDHDAVAPDVELVRAALVRALDSIEPAAVVDALEARARGTQRPPPSGRWPRWRPPKPSSRTPRSCSGRTWELVWFLRATAPRPCAAGLPTSLSMRTTSARSSRSLPEVCCAPT